MDKLEDVCAKKGRKRCCNGANILADPIVKGLRVRTIPASGSANLVNQGLKGRVISIAERIEELRLGLHGRRVRFTEVVVIACSNLAVHSHVA